MSLISRVWFIVFSLFSMLICHDEGASEIPAHACGCHEPDWYIGITRRIGRGVCVTTPCFSTHVQHSICKDSHMRKFRFYQIIHPQFMQLYPNTFIQHRIWLNWAVFFNWTVTTSCGANKNMQAAMWQKHNMAYKQTYITCMNVVAHGQNRLEELAKPPTWSPTYTNPLAQPKGPKGSSASRHTGLHTPL